MSNLTVIKHPIQKFILSSLQYVKYASFSDLRPSKINTNLYSYHLKILQNAGIIIKTDLGYRLSGLGMSYVETKSDPGFHAGKDIKLAVMLVIQDAEGNVLLSRRKHQPYIDDWSLPTAELHADDNSSVQSVQKLAAEKLEMPSVKLRHAGDCYIRVSLNGSGNIATTFAHVFYGEVGDGSASREDMSWVKPLKLGNYQLAPAVENIITRTFFGDNHFFEEFKEELLQ